MLLFIIQTQIQPLVARQFSQFLRFQTASNQQIVDTSKQTGFQDLQLFSQVFLNLLELHLFDFECTLVFLYAITGKDLNVDNGTGGAIWYAQGRILHVRRFLTEDRTQQLLFWRQLGFTFRRYLTNQNVTALHFRTDIHDTGFVQLRQRCFTHVRDVSRDLFRAQLSITRYTCQFLDVNSGETVFLNYTLGNQDGVFEVVTVPWHERHAHVLTQFTQIGGRTVCQHITTLNRLTQ